MAREKAEQEARFQAIRERNQMEELERQKRNAEAEKANEDFRRRGQLALEKQAEEIRR